MIRRTISVIGSLVCLAGLSLGLVYLWSAGWLDRLTPAPRFAEPVTVAVHGPKEVLAGGEYYFHVEITGSAGKPMPVLVPDEPAALTLFPDGRTLRFQSSIPGVRVLTVSVAGDGRQVASSVIEFENLLVNEEPVEPEPQQPALSFEEIQSLIMPTVPPVATVADRTRESLDGIASANKAEEAHRIAGIIKSIIQRINTGLVAPDADVTLELESQIELALGKHARPWGIFIADVRGIFGSLREQGAITTAASTVPTLTEIAAVLSSVH